MEGPLPGGTLNQLERSLLARWDQPDRYEYPLLRSITVGGDAGIRGLKDVTLEFRYPVTTVVGRNATGKSTWLALAALAFHSPQGHTPVNVLRRPKRGESGSYYTFQDFFFRGPHDGSYVGAEVTWEYSGRRQPLTVRRKTEKKWMVYERRPKRPVHFFGIARTVPAIERRVLRAHFPPSPRSVKSHVLDDVHLGYLKRITGLDYQLAEVFEADRYQLRGARTEHAYSSFNMGAGEDLLIEVLYLLQETPPGSLVVIEEIELGLHPRAVKELAGVLLDVAQRKGLQIIVSSHSRDFIDAMPRLSRVLVEREGGLNRIHYGPTTRFAVSGMSGEAMPELIVYCEDNFARQLIETSLPVDTLKRVQVTPVGSEGELVPCAAYHVRAGVPGKALLVWDGDVVDRNIDGWLRRHHDAETVPWTKLPGDVAPERWVAERLLSDGGVSAVARLFNTREDRARDVLTRLAGMEDPHHLAYLASQELGLDPVLSEHLLLAALRHVPQAGLAALVDEIQAVLDDRPRGDHQATTAG